MAQKRGSCSRGTPIQTTAPKGPSYGVEVLTLLIASYPRSCCDRRAQSQGRSAFVAVANLLVAVEPTAGVLGVPRREKSPPAVPTAFPVPRNGRAAAYLRLAVPGALRRIRVGTAACNLARPLGAARPANGQLCSGRRDRSFETVNLLRIVAEDRAALGFTQGDLDGTTRIVIVPVRIVARVDDTIPADPIEDGTQVLRVLRLFDRLCRVPKIAVQVLRWLELKVWNLTPHLCDVGVEPPTEGRNPGKAALDQNDL